jgi:hypothetical protein
MAQQAGRAYASIIRTQEPLDAETAERMRALGYAR